MSANEDREIWFLNRDVMVVRPAQPFIDWALALDDEDLLQHDDVAGASNAFLIPEFEDEEETWAWVRVNCDTMFDYMLHDWSVDPGEWPEGRGWDAFQKWFAFEHIQMAWDLVDEPLSSDPPPMDGDDMEEWDA